MDFSLSTFLFDIDAKRKVDTKEKHSNHSNATRRNRVLRTALRARFALADKIN